MIHNNALTKNIQIPLWFLLVGVGYGLFEIYTLKRTDRGILSDDELWYD